MLNPSRHKTFLLMTGCIAPGGTPFVKITSPKERLQQYIYSIICWMVNTNIKNIIFCENSNFKYDYDFLHDLAQYLNKTLEILVFDGNKGSFVRGKGYGEGEIIKYALDNSKIITQDVSIYKITGRLFIRNFNLIFQKHESVKNIFNKLCHNIKDQVDTRFFKFSMDFYKKYLFNLYMDVDDFNGKSLENLFYNSLKDLDMPNFLIYPDIIGVSATTRAPYELSKKSLFFRNILSKFNFYKV
ncbi:hypothetical protein A3J90_06675 [candidate division WOR-1 bacterium RIFOXYC2_FULL_37_10]|uniref:Uncharacterized protein n=1 Tax=candidate division WOR-1 bacterium RIFOXYB2_FULL_37_13 TaxID=1802579 RepID=A0A1F4SSB0_UNCSA|nr:MAG: hypothetical protein A2310_07280 [candidate division WOR-1 bacterium RIFOXYB2_FULL_37_13]OGC33382.1 MAG: hypothetical protein A3J90_06675 [candidate division WOR-1 bacterium RIFOXYC2_FULL_37_10]